MTHRQPACPKCGITLPECSGCMTTWTSDPPTEDGWYWIRYGGEGWLGEIQDTPHFFRLRRDHWEAWDPWEMRSAGYYLGDERAFDPWPFTGYLRSTEPLRPPEA